MLGLSILLFRYYLEKWQVAMREASDDVDFYIADALDDGVEFFGSSIWIIILAIIISFVAKWVISGR